MYKRLFGSDPPPEAAVWSDDDLVRLAMIKRQLGPGYVVCNLTSIPPRFKYLQKVVDNLRTHLVFDDIVIHVPKTYSRFPDLIPTPPQITGATVKVAERDYGPGTRIVYGLGSTIVWCDDDTEYHHSVSLTLFEKHLKLGACCGTSGFRFSKYFRGDFTKTSGEEVQVVEGYGMVVAKQEWIDLIRDEFIALNKLTYHDDMIFSNLLEKIGVRKFIFPECGVNQHKYGFCEDALHYNNGDGSHMGNNRRILGLFKDAGAMYHKPTVSYAIGVCDEAVELDVLLRALDESMVQSDEVVILVDRTRVTSQVREVLARWGSRVNVFEREFDGHFSKHKNYLNSKCRGEFIFNIDADEVPSSALVENIYQLISNGADLIYVPRVNLIPGATQKFLAECNFHLNKEGFINWPDMQGRIYRRGLMWGGDIHERIQGAQKTGQLQPEAMLSIWHVKSIDRMRKQKEYYQKRGS
jgi:Glycosyl transferase family 2